MWGAVPVLRELPVGWVDFSGLELGRGSGTLVAHVGHFIPGSNAVDIAANGFPERNLSGSSRQVEFSVKVWTV